MSSVPFYLKVGSNLMKITARQNSRLATVIRKTGIAQGEFSECNYKLSCGKCVV